jgi:hypothetical protein
MDVATTFFSVLCKTKSHLYSTKILHTGKHPAPGRGGGGYQPMSLGLENIKRGWEKREIEGKWGKKGLCMKLESKRIK